MLKAISLQQPKQQESIDLPEGSWPYTVLPANKWDGTYVSLWGKSAVAVVGEVRRPGGEVVPAVVATWPVAAHPTEMVLSPDESLLYVACPRQQCGRA